jgi:Ca-activated chloride channel homolog
MRQAAVLLGVFALFFAADQTGSAEGDACHDDVVLVFDASGSMAHPTAEEGEGLTRTRIDVARAAVADIAPAVTQNRRSALIAYGPYGACEVHTLLPLASNSSAVFIASVSAQRAGGFTPLTLGLRRATALLQERGGTIILVTDGIESCRENPCAAARAIAELRPRVTVHVIGYLIGSAYGGDVACVAEQTGGVYAAADTLPELTRALSQAVGCPQISARGFRPRLATLHHTDAS